MAGFDLQWKTERRVTWDFSVHGVFARRYIANLLRTTIALHNLINTKIPKEETPEEKKKREKEAKAKKEKEEKEEKEKEEKKDEKEKK